MALSIRISHQPSLYQAWVTIQGDKHTTFKIFHDTNAHQFLQSLRTIGNINLEAAKQVHFVTKDGVFMDIQQISYYPIILSIKSLEIVSLSFDSRSYEVVYVVEHQKDQDSKSIFLNFNEYDQHPLQKPILWPKMNTTDLSHTVHVVSVFGQVSAGKSRVLYEYTHDGTLFDQSHQTRPKILHECQNGTTMDMHLYEPRTSYQFREKVESMHSVKCLDVAGIPSDCQSTRRKTFIKKYARFLYCLSDVMLVVVNSSTYRNTLDILFDAVSNIEIKYRPHLVLILNNELEQNKKIVESELDRLRTHQFSFFKYIWVPSCLTHSELFSSKIKTLNIEIMNSLISQRNIKKEANFTNEIWYLFAERILKSNQNVYDIIDELTLTTHRIIDEIFSAYFSKGKISFFSTLLVVCKYVGLKKEFSFIERKKIVELFMRRVPIVLDYPNFNKDVVEIMDRYTRFHFNDTNESVFEGHVSLATSKQSFKDILGVIDPKHDWLKIWKIRLDEASVYYPNIYRSIQSDSWCPICFEAKCEIAIFKCKHLICKKCHIASKQNECPLCKKEITHLLEYTTLDLHIPNLNQVKGKRIIAIIGDIPNSIKGYEYHSMLIKMIKNQKITLIHDSNFCFIYFAGSSNTRDSSEKSLLLASWISRHVIDSYGITWKTIFSTKQTSNLISYHKFYYLVHFLDVYNQKYMYSLIEPGNYSIHEKILREKDVTAISRNFETILTDYEKPCMKAELSLLRYYIKSRTNAASLSPIVPKCYERFLWIRDEPIGIVKYLILMAYKESIDLYDKFQTVDSIPIVCQAYIINLLQNATFGNYYRESLTNWQYKNIFEVFDVVMKSEPFEDLAKFHSNLSFHQVRQKVDELFYQLHEIPKIPKQSFSVDQGWTSNDTRYPIWCMNWKLSEMREVDKEKILKILRIEHPSLVSVLGYRLDSTNDNFGLYYSDFQLIETKKLNIKDEFFAFTIALGILHLHQNGIIHGNISSKSIFIRDDRPILGFIGKAELMSTKGINSDVYQFGMLLVWYVLRDLSDQDDIYILMERLKPKATPKYFEIVEKCFDISEYVNFDTIVTILSTN